MVNFISLSKRNLMIHHQNYGFCNYSNIVSIIHGCLLIFGLTLICASNKKKW